MSLSSPPGTSVQSPKDFDKLSSETPLPTEIQQLPENLQNLLLGRISATKTIYKTRKIVIYVCAADSQDCCFEKSLLHNSVYPELRDYCRAQGYELHIVDLHWTTSLEKQRDHEFPQLCLGELARQMDVAYIIPVLFLSNSLGTPLLPNTIEYQDFEMTLRDADNKESLQKWYKLDTFAQPPCYRLQPCNVHIPGFKDSSPEEKERALEEWCAEIERTLTVMVKVFSEELRDSYLTTVVEQEVHNTVFMSQELARRCLWVYRVYTHRNPSPEQETLIEAELRRRLDNLHKDLRNQLCEKHILRLPVRWAEGGLNPDIADHAFYLEEITKYMKENLRQNVDHIMEEDQAKGVIKSCYGISGSLFQELMQQTIHCQRAALSSINRETLHLDLKNYLVGEYRTPFILYGPRGCGKSTLVARVAQSCHVWLPDAVVAMRFVGISPHSSTLESVLKSLVEQFSALSSGHPYYGPHNVEMYGENLGRLQTALCLQRPVVIIVDGLDQLRDYGSCNVDWMPITLPENIKIILTMIQECPVYSTVRMKLKDKDCFLKIPKLGKHEAQTILMASVMQYNHSINSRIQECVRSAIQNCTSPLYVKVLSWQTSWWSSRDCNLEAKKSVADQLTSMLEQLELILEKDKVAFALALTTVSKTGLYDSDVLDMLAFNESFQSKETYVIWAPACLFWAMLNKYLAPFLCWFQASGPSFMYWRDRLLHDIIVKRYQSSHQQARRTLIDFYNGKWGRSKESGLEARYITQPNKCDKRYNTQKLIELPYQTYWLNKTIKKDFLLNHSWLYDKLCGCSVFEVLQDIFLEENGPNNNKDSLDEDLSLLKKFLEDNAYALSYDGRQFYSQIYAFCDAHFKSRMDNSELHKVSEKYSFISNLYNISKNPPVLSMIPLTTVSEKDNEDSLRDKAEADDDDLSQLKFDLVVRLRDNPDYVATVSTEREEISVWDICSTTRVRTLVSITHPINLKAIDDYKCVVLCRRELRVYNLDSGTFVNRLKGVMNQKMPYYGLHDKEHLVALSRNRMYVNLMNLESGDCVTTFKAGEDRFLNSLLVSGDGRVLVCGDETQKPFPLLVWNLSSRKLLYDLRIPHHDFVTSLSAITYEGHYVCCVCKEVDEPNPNFIVVYDLQSGTLFKKWKPSVNTVSLEISSRDCCVISGLEDARILVWDLVTGNCRFILYGHTAPVNFLKLDPLGGSFLSADSCCRDRSLRLWELNKGELLAVFTPDRPVTSCEIIYGGRSVVLALRGRTCITTLQLRGPNIPARTSASHVYGLPENCGKVFDLREEAAAER